MAYRMIAGEQLARLLGFLSHPHRIRLVEELRDGERDVNALVRGLALRQSAVSQHLALLRASNVVAERREGRHVYYRLRHPRLAKWLLAGLEFVGPGGETDQLVAALARAKQAWGTKVNAAKVSARLAKP